MSVDWKGKQVSEKLLAACERGMLETASECVATSKALVHKDTTSLQGSIRIDPEGVRREGGQLSLDWGSHDIEYAIWQEFLPGEEMPGVGTRLLAGGKPYLRPSADEHYGELPERIRRAFGRPI